MSDGATWTLRVAAPAARKIAEVLPEAVAAAVVEFITGARMENPQRAGRPLQRELSGRHAARRGTFRVVYRIDDGDHLVEVIDVALPDSRGQRWHP